MAWVQISVSLKVMGSVYYYFIYLPCLSLTRLYAASSRARYRPRGFAARGFAATHGRGHVYTTINIEIICYACVRCFGL